MNIELVKEEIAKNKGRKVFLKIYGMRNKSEQFEGVISETYPKIFIVKNDYESRSISYADVITKDVVIKYR